jgi:hypothetical protein
MKIRYITKASFPVMFALLLIVAAAGAGEQGRIPPNVKKYPAKGGVEKTTSEVLTIYTNDNANSVSDYYRNKMNMEPVEKGRYLVGTDATYKDKIGHTDFPLWLNISPARRVLEDKDLFGFLQQEIMVKRMHSEKELEQVRAKYAHLAEAWYPDFDAEKRLRSCADEARSNVSRARSREPRRNKAQEREMVAEMQRLMAQGRHKEAAALAQRSAKPGMETSKAMQQDNRTDHWDKWLSCLDELDRHDFRTRIEIDLYSRHFKPSTDAERKDRAGQAAELNSERQTSQKKREAAEDRDVNEKMKGLKKLFKF